MCSEPQAPPRDFKKRFQRLADSDVNSDCEFIVGPQKSLIKGHKVIFGLASEVFQAMFFGNLKEDSVRIEDLEPDGFRGMKTFIYTGEVSFKSAIHALSTYIAARKYMIADLQSECSKYINSKIQSSEGLEFVDRCQRNVINEFNDLCHLIIEEITEEVLGSEYFLSACIQTIELILKSPSLRLNSEVELFRYFERWALAEAERRKIPANCVSTSFNALKKHIRFLTISADDFVTTIEPSPLLTRDEKYAIALNKLKFNSDLTLDSISMTTKSRSFNKLLCIQQKHQQKHMFDIGIINHRPLHFGTLIRSNPQNKINLLAREGTNNVMSLHWSIFHECISFEAKPHIVSCKSGLGLVVIKSKFRVLAVNQCDDLFFENESRHIFSNKGNYSSEYQGNVVLAVIPTAGIIENGRFHRNRDRSTISIEGTFDVDLMYL